MLHLLLGALSSSLVQSLKASTVAILIMRVHTVHSLEVEHNIWCFVGAKCCVMDMKCIRSPFVCQMVNDSCWVGFKKKVDYIKHFRGIDLVLGKEVERERWKEWDSLGGGQRDALTTFSMLILGMSLQQIHKLSIVTYSELVDQLFVLFVIRETI